MRKRILCTALLSLLALWVMALPAMAADKNYYKLNSVTAGTKTYTVTGDYASTVTLPTGDKALTFTVKAATKSDTTTPPGYTDATSVAWTVVTDSAAMVDSSNKITCSPTSSTLKTDALTHTMTLTGKVKCSGTVTVTATLGSGATAQTKTATVKITVPDKPDPKITAETDKAVEFSGKAAASGAVLKLLDSAGKEVKNKSNKYVLQFTNFPETVTTDPVATELIKYGVTVTPASYTTSSATADTTRDIEFTSDASKITKTTDGLEVKVKVSNTKADGTKGADVTKTITLKIDAIKPEKWATEAGGQSKDLGSKATTISSKKTNNLTLVKASMDIGTALTWELQNITTPTTFTAEGLPPGLSLDYINTANKTSATAEKGSQGTKFGVKITGTPTTPGYYDKIYITAKNAGGELKGGPYILDIVKGAEITVDEIPDMTWGKDYTYTIPAVGGENKKHPLTFGIKTPANSPGLKITSATKGTLAGRYESSDKEASKFALGDDEEKEVTLTLQVKNDFADSVDKNVTFKIKGVKPVLVNNASAAQNELNKATFKALNAVEWKNDEVKYPISVTGPGNFTFTYENLPAGITPTEQAQDKDHPSRQVVTFEGTPEITAKNHSATVTVSNALGSQKIPLKFNITAEKEDFTITPAAGDIAPIAVDREKAIDDFALEAAFGPVVWKAKNLPSGLKLSIDKSVSFDKKVVITGTPKSATKPDKNGHCIYEITATNPPTGLSVVVSQDLKLFEKPKIQTKTLPNINLEKNYSAKIVGSGGTSADLTWTVTIEEVEAGTSDKEALKTSLPATKGVIDASSTSDLNVGDGTSKIVVSSDAKTGMPIIVGSLDRMPAGGRLKVTATVKVSEGNPDVQESEPANIIVQVKGTAAKITTPSTVKFTKGDTDSTVDVTATGTLPIYMKALVAEDDVKKLLNFDTAVAAATALGVGTYSETVKVGNTTKTYTYLDLTNKDSGNKLGINFVYDTSANDGKGKLQATSDGAYNIANLPIKIQAGNAVTYNNKTYKVDLKSADKVVKVTITGAGPVWKRGSDAASPDITIFETDGTPITDVTYTVSADLPYTITVSPTTTSDKTRNGLYAEITQPTSSAAGKVVIKGTPTKDKETKTMFTLAVTNTSSKQKSQAKVTFIGQKRPEITTKITDGYLAEKVVEVGKPLSYKIAAKGSKIAYSKASRDIEASSTNKIFATNMVAYAPIVWEISGDTTKLAAIGIAFDTNTGMFKGTPTGATSKDNKKYVPFEFEIQPKNTAGGPALSAAKAKVKIGVKGKKPRLTTKTITLVRGKESFDLEEHQLATNIMSNDTSAYVTWKWDDNADYETWGFAKAMTRNGNLGKLSGTLKTATRGVSLRVVADNLSSDVAGNVRFIIRDQDPQIKASTETVSMTAEKDATVTEDVDFELTDKANMMTGDTKIEWKISSQPSDKSVKAKLVVTGDGESCTVTLTAAKGISPDVSADFTVTAKNKSTSATASKTVKIKVTKYTAALPAEKDATPEDNAALPESESAEETLTEEEELAAGEGTVTYGRARTESGLTQAERSMLAEGGYVIAAILPEITTDASGQYDLDVVSLDEAAAEGAELVWFAFPRNAESTEDDSIAEFYDEAGAEIYAVPESKKVVVSPWLEAEVTYAPVIAVKAPVAGDAKTSLDEAEEGDTVTEQAIENAIETPAEK